MSEPRDRAFRLAMLLPSALLVAVALAQIALAHGGRLSPWKGGGFGMFAATDGARERTLRVLAIGPERSEALAIPRALRTEAARAALDPTDARLERLARLFADREVRAGRPTTEVRIEVWKTTFRESSLEPRAELLVESRTETAP